MDGKKKSLIYTRTGDRGTTSLVGGRRVSKSDPRLEAYGTIDELNSNLGFLRAIIDDNTESEFILRIQNCLFSVGGYLATDIESSKLNSACVVTDAMVGVLERKIDEIDSSLPMLKAFVIPGGNKAAAYCHVCRTVCRRAERLIIHLSEIVTIDYIIVSYINRLSDYLFILSRKLNNKDENNEIFWDKTCI